MTGNINWAAYTQANVNGGAIQTQGNNVADYEIVLTTATSAVAPEGTMYASVYCDVASTIKANVISTPDNKTIFNANTTYCGAAERIEIPNVIAGKTTLTVTDIA